MPLFEYKCARCQTRFEELVRNNDAEPVACPVCGEPGPVRQLSTFARCGDSTASAASSNSCGNRGGFS